MSSSSTPLGRCDATPPSAGVHLRSPLPQVLGGVIASWSSSSVRSTSMADPSPHSRLGRSLLLLSWRIVRPLLLPPALSVDDDVPEPELISVEWPSFSATRAAAQAHSSVRLVRVFFPKSMNSRGGGLRGGARGEEGMFSQIGPEGLWRRDGVRGAPTRSSERDATRSREGREALEVLLLVVLSDGEAVRDVPLRLNVCMVLVMLGTALEVEWPLLLVLLVAADFLSVWRLFWNQMVTDFISLWYRTRVASVVSWDVDPRNKTQNETTYMPPAFATASRSSRDGCEFWWKRFSSIVSWVLVNRFRVRRELLTVTVLELIDAPSSSDEKLVDEDVLESGSGGRLIVGWIPERGTRQIWSWFVFIQPTMVWLKINFSADSDRTTTRQIYHVGSRFHQRLVSQMSSRLKTCCYVWGQIQLFGKGSRIEHAKCRI